MESWRKQHGEGHHQVGHWTGSSSFYTRKPPLEIWQPTVPRWEKMFCSTIGSVPWGKLVETKKYMHLHGNVMNWDDSAGREAFHDAKSRFWAAMNGLPCNVSLPDPNIYIDDIKWNLSVDPALILDLERDATVPNEEEKDDEVVILGDPFVLNQPFCYNGWGEAEAGAPKRIDSCSSALVNLHENTREGPWEQHHALDEATKVYEWKNCRNGSWGWNQREHHHTDAYKMGKRIGGWNRGTWNWFKRNGENMPWNTVSAYHYGNRYQKNRGRKYYKGNRVTFTYDCPCVEKKQTYCYVNEEDTEGKDP